MNPVVISAVETIASKVRGSAYHIDRRLPFSALLGYAVRRLCWLCRGSLKALFFCNRWRLVFMASDVELRNAKLISFGKCVCLDHGAFIDGLAIEGIKLGNYVTIGRNSIIRSTGVLSNLGVGVIIGDRSSMDAFCFVGAAGQVEIGSDVIMGQHVSFHAEEHVIARIDVPIKNQGTTRRGITIGDGCWIGSNVTFLDGAQVGRGCVVGAGAVVRGHIPDYAIAAGVPAKVIRMRGASDRAATFVQDDPSF